MDYRVERHSAGERSIAKVQRRHVADFEFNAGSQRSRDADHLWRKIDPDDIGASVMQILCDLSRSAAEVGDYSLLTHFLGEAIQEMTVEWFSVQLVEQVLGVSRRGCVIAPSHIHTGSSRIESERAIRFVLSVAVQFL